MNWPLDTCPTVDQWQQFLLGELEERWQKQCCEHLEHCEACCDRVGELSDDDLVGFRDTKKPSNRPTLEDFLARRISRPGDDPPAIDGYDVIGEVGQGAAGTVYRALQTQPFEREVAIKVIDSTFRGIEFQRRFRREANSLAAMNHPGIAALFDAGTLTDGRAYLVMEFVSGLTLREYARWSTLSFDDRLILLEDICRAVDYAHSRGIVHRDLKPTNILIHLDSGEPRAKIIDFGLAKIQFDDPDADLTQTKPGAIQGTYRYMSPEQARGELSSKLDHRSDVYSLGVIAFELLTGVTPLGLTLADLNRDVKEIIDAICEGEVPKPSQTVAKFAGDHPAGDNLVRDKVDDCLESMRCKREDLSRRLRGDLDRMIQKATEKNRSDRYASAAELAEDLRRVRSDQPVLVGPPSLAYRAKKFYRRNREVTWFAGAVVTLLTLGIMGTTAGFLEARSSQRRATRSALREADARVRAEAAQEQERVARMAAERRSEYLRSSAKMLQTIIEGVSPEFAQANAADLRASVIEKLKRVGDELIALPVAKGDDPLDVESKTAQLELEANLARSLSAFGDHDRSAALWERIVASLESMVPESSLDFLVPLFNLADAHVDAENLDRGWEVASRANRLAHEHHAENRPIVLFSLLILGSAEKTRGDFEPALAKMIEARSGMEAIGMKSTPMWADCVGSMAPLQIETEQYQDAIESCREVIEYYDQTGLAVSSPLRLAVAQNLAIALKKSGQVDQAWQTIRDAGRVAERHLPAGSDVKNAFDHNLAVIMSLVPDRRDEAREIMRRLATEAQPMIALRAKIDLNKLNFVDGDRPARESAIQKARSLADEAAETLGADHPVTRTALARLADMTAQ